MIRFRIEFQVVRLIASPSLPLYTPPRSRRRGCRPPRRACILDRYSLLGRDESSPAICLGSSIEIRPSPDAPQWPAGCSPGYDPERWARPSEARSYSATASSEFRDRYLHRPPVALPGGQECWRRSCPARVPSRPPRLIVVYYWPVVAMPCSGVGLFELIQ